MATSYITEYGGGGPRDLEELVEVGATPGYTGFNVANGNDVSQQFAPLSSGSRIGFNTGFVALDGRDLADWFAAKGSVSPPLNWIGTISCIDGSNGNFGYASQIGWGSLTTTSGGPIPEGFLYEASPNYTTLQLPTRAQPYPAQCTFTWGGTTLVMALIPPRFYRVSGDAFNIQGQLNVALNASLST